MIAHIKNIIYTPALVPEADVVHVLHCSSIAHSMATTLTGLFAHNHRCQFHLVLTCRRVRAVQYLHARQRGGCLQHNMCNMHSAPPTTGKCRTLMASTHSSA